jgi:RNA polymerase sigma-70 factor, ECF subfamily
MPKPAHATDPVAGAYGELRSSLLAYLRKHVGDAQAAEDLLHDVVIKALAATADRELAPRNLAGWLYATARNAAMDYHRRGRNHRHAAELSDALISTLAVESPDEAQAAIESLAHCLRPMAERLPDTYRDTVLAAEFDGQPLQAVARAQGISLVAAKQRASRGRRLLQAEIVRCCSVTLSTDGKVLDYDCAAAAACGPDPQGHGCR